jgi:glycosyltransferase involved in cell wall biosynthesis
MNNIETPLKLNKLIRITTVPMSLDKLIEGQLTFMQSHYEVIAVSSGGEALDAIGVKENVRVVPIEMSRKITLFKDIRAVWEIYRFLKKENPFIVHTHTPKAGIVGMLASYLSKVPNRLHTVAGLPLLEAKGVKRIVLNFVEKLTYFFATKVYPNSYGLKNIILENRFTKKSKLKVIVNGSSNGINLNFFKYSNISNEVIVELKSNLGILENDFVYVFVGRLVADKGVNELVKAFTQIAKFNKSFKLLLVGHFESDLDPLDENTLTTIDVENQILFVGFQKDVRPYLCISNVLVFPSYREGFPNVVMQAGAMNLPSIVTNINGCNEIIEDLHNGLIIEPKDIESLKKAMLNIFEDKKLYTTCAENARKVISSKYEQKLYWNALLQEYNTLLN